MALGQATRTAIQAAIKDRRRYRRWGNVSVAPVPESNTGRLPDEWRARWDEDRETGAIDYVVYSYLTPIAWYVTDLGYWRVPPVRYSPTTTNHQTAVKVAIHATDQRYEPCLTPPP